jgi:hypothetical protein
MPRKKRLEEELIENDTERARAGRPSKFSTSLAASLTSHVSNGVDLAHACSLCHVDRTTLWRWRRSHPQFTIAMRAAMKVGKKRRAEYCNVKMRRRKANGKRASPRPRRYRTEMLMRVQPSIRATAQALGVHYLTVWRWTRRYPDFGLAMAIARWRVTIDRLERRFG